MRLSRLSLAYGAGSFASSALHSAFIMYYVALFAPVIGISDNNDSSNSVAVVRSVASEDVGGSNGTSTAQSIPSPFSVTPAWFLWGEFVFAIWNAMNDGVAGYVFSKRWIRRETAIKLGGPIWCVALVTLFCFPTGYFATPDARGLHFVLGLFFYDGALSLVLLAHGSVLSDLALGTAERAELNAVNSFLGALGASTVIFAHLSWAQGIETFQRYCMILAVISSAIFWFSADVLWFHSSRLRRTDGVALEPVPTVSKNSPAKTTAADSAVPEVISWARFLTMVRRIGNFWKFTFFNFLQVFNCHFNSNFLPQFLAILIASTLPLWVHSTVVTLANILPHVGVVYLASSVTQLGLWGVMNRLVWMKLVLPVVVALILMLTSDFFGESQGQYHAVIILALYLVANKTNSELICRHGTLVLADVTDEFGVTEYSELVNKPKMVPAWGPFVLGTNAAFTKPGASVAPAVGWWLMTRGGSSVKLAVFGVPIVVAIIQLFVWKFYTLRGPRLQEMRRWRKIMDDRERGDEL